MEAGLLLCILLFLIPSSLSVPPESFYINCGALDLIEFNGRQWLPDSNFISVGTQIDVPYQRVLPLLSTVRSFSQERNKNKKFCYKIGPVVRSAKYMIRTTYFYGGVNGEYHKTPPVFNQIVDGTLWSLVNTTDDYARYLSSYYEGVFQAMRKTMSFCLGVNEHTDSDPFISTIELVMLKASVYNSTEFGKFGLSLVARHNFGYKGSIIRSPDDPFDRFWQPFGPYTPVAGNPNVSVSGFWNLPPSMIFDTCLTVDSGAWELQWPEGPLPSSNYYIALYFADDGASASGRTFSITINDVPYFKELNVTSSGVAVFATQWPLSGLTTMKFTPVVGSGAGPVVNGGEVFKVLLLGNRTLAHDVRALESIKRRLKNPPDDWSGDPCFPAGFSWTGIACSSNGTRVRVISINLMDMGLSGSLSPAIGNLTALTTIVLRSNSLTGHIPSNLGALRQLEVLDLENNQFNGTIPSSLGTIRSLQELHIENNNLQGKIPKAILQKPGLNFTFSPGNHLLLVAKQKT